MSDRVVRVTVPASEVELASDALWIAGAAGIEERRVDAAGGDRSSDPGEGRGGDPGGGPVVLVAGPEAGRDAAPLLAAVAGRWPAELVAVDLAAALDAWRDHARAVRIGPLLVRPPWVGPPTSTAGDEDGRDDEASPRADGSSDGDIIDVVIDPGRAFGSGAHASTRLALAALVDHVPAGGRVLDVGCGSGVLAIAAVLLGAAEAVALDHDPGAVEATRANSERNGVAGRVTALAADAAHSGAPGRSGGTTSAATLTEPFDLVVANMLLPDLVGAAPLLAAAVADDGTVLLSGLLAEQQPTAETAYAAAGLITEPASAPVGAGAEDEWIAMLFRRSADCRASGGSAR